jgi:lysophospholipase
MLSDPAKGHVKFFDDYLEDVDAVFKDIVTPLGVRRRIVLAHSMGGAVALRMAIRDADMFERYVLCAPMIGLAMKNYTATARFAASLFAALGFGSRYIPNGGPYPFIPFEGNPLTSDFRRFDRSDAVLRAAPELAIGSPTLAWAATSFTAMAELQFEGTPKAISNPVLALAGPDDAVTSTPAIRKFVSGLRAGCLIEINGARHEILQENDLVRERFWQEFDRFVDEG